MKAIVENLAIEYTDEGDGPVILMLHGWGDTLHTFDPILQYNLRYRVVRLDMPGFGGSERARETWGVIEYARFVREFCKKIRIEPVVLVGHSFGGRVIIKGTAQHVFTPQKIVLIASAGIAHPKTFKNYALRALAKIGKTLTTIPPFSSYRISIRKKLYARLGSDYFAAGSMRDVFIKVVREDLQEYARQIRIPALLIWGSEDTQTPLADGETIRDEIQGSQLEVIGGATHFVHQEKPAKVAELIQEFVQ